MVPPINGIGCSKVSYLRLFDDFITDDGIVEGIFKVNLLCTKRFNYLIVIVCRRFYVSTCFYVQVIFSKRTLSQKGKRRRSSVRVGQRS